MQYPCFPSLSEPLVPPEVFRNFHTIDRSLYSRLVFQLSRDPGESSKVMALWLWMERTNSRQLGHQWILRTLLPSHPTPLNAFADESVAALNTLEWDPSSPAPAPSAFDLPMFFSMTGKLVSLKDFYDHRGNVARGVNEMLEQVCARAFQDLMQWAVELRAAAAVAIARSSTRNPPSVPAAMVMRMPPMRFEPVAVPPRMPLRRAPPPPPLSHFVAIMPSELQYMHQNYVPYGNGGHGLSNSDDDHLGVRGINDDNRVNQDLSESLMRGLDLNVAYEDHEGGDNYQLNQVDLVPADERTIFLTFSKGYPISESEIRDFFNSRFGDDLIEVIIMQDVRSPDDQPIYARLVVRSLSAVDVVLEGRPRMKFSIDGKHIWARRYVPDRDNISM